ncbi:MAG: hypothetical protein GF364_02040 [Candidatus Lokiarchaeota archaeon]|nr:hypothetical protein [Candidatus Lokiarchaeota archaeon]
MENENDGKKSKIIEELQKLGFTMNDAKVYFALVNLGKSNPAKIAEISGVDRARVYDSLRRLVKKRIVEEEPVKRAPSYKAKPPKLVFNRFREKYARKLELSTQLQKKLEKYNIPVEDPAIWALQGVKKITRAINQLVENANEQIYMILSPDIANHTIFIIEISEIMEDKIRDIPEMDIQIGLNVNDNHTSIIKQLLRSDIGVYHWASGGILPFGIYLSENTFIMTILSDVGDIPEYSFGLTMENATKDIIDGFIHLVNWCYANLCKRVGLKKK